MKQMIIAALCLVLLSAGCVEQKGETDDIKKDTTIAGKSSESFTVTITSPKAGDILDGDEIVSFDAAVNGGEKPVSFVWSSSIDGELSTSQSFKLNPSKLGKGSHAIILKVTDASGSSKQGTVLVEVM